MIKKIETIITYLAAFIFFICACLLDSEEIASFVLIMTVCAAWIFHILINKERQHE